MKRLTLYLMFLAGMLCVLPQANSNPSDNSGNTKCVKITGNNVRLRYGPGVGYEIYCSLNKGAVLTYYGLSADNNWYNVGYKGHSLYVSRDYASLCDCGGNTTTVAQKTKCIVHAKNLRLRTGPGTNYAYLTWLETGQTVYLNHGDVLEYLGTTVNGFYKVRFRGYDCWISSDYCTLK